MIATLNASKKEKRKIFSSITREQVNPLQSRGKNVFAIIFFLNLKTSKSGKEMSNKKYFTIIIEKLRDTREEKIEEIILRLFEKRKTLQ